MKADPAVVLEGVRFGWTAERPVLSISQFSVERGERVFILGPSGSGKSTLLGLIGGVLQPQSGRVRVLGAELTELSGWKRDAFRAAHVGFVFQIFNLLPYLSVVDNVLLSTRFSAERRARVAELGARAEAVRLLAALGIASQRLLQRPVAQLSVGQQQRVAVARALIGSPALLIADEPTSSLDFAARASFLDLLMRECRAASTTVVFVSHDTTLRTHFDRVIALAEVNGCAATEEEG